MRIGYQGISPFSKWGDETLNQEQRLKDCDNVITEKATWFSEKMTLAPSIDSLNTGDEFVICSLRFLAQDTKKLIALIERIESKGATLTVLDMENSLSGYFKALKAFDHYVTSAKIMKGQSNSKKTPGRKPIDRYTILHVKNLNKTSKMSISKIAVETGISRRSVNRILNNEEK
jgi:DNA invertase Pin-like site-specific DNA recombinase